MAKKPFWGTSFDAAPAFVAPASWILLNTVCLPMFIALAGEPTTGKPAAAPQ